LALEEMGALRAEESGSVWDGIVGARGHVNLTEKWYLPFYADIGTGQSKLTWQALGGIGYRFKWFDFTVAYRYLSWDFGGGAPLDDLQIYGPYAGFIFHF
jgi:hypothetical protein